MPPGGERPRSLAEFRGLECAEDFLHFFGIEADPRVLAVNRLHILRRFSRDLAEIDGLAPAPAEAERLALYEGALRRAYALFLRSSPREQQLFGVLQGGGPCAGCRGATGCGSAPG
jgi:nitrogenase-stabilizing/protective protein